MMAIAALAGMWVPSLTMLRLVRHKLGNPPTAHVANELVRNCRNALDPTAKLIAGGTRVIAI